MSRITYRGRDQWSGRGAPRHYTMPIADEDAPSWRLLGLLFAIFLITSLLVAGSL